MEQFDDFTDQRARLGTILPRGRYIRAEELATRLPAFSRAWPARAAA
jgi:hypothetical protein